MLDVQLKDVVIVCIGGFRFTGNPDVGVKDLVGRLQTALEDLGVPKNNIFHRSWNEGNDSDPGKPPQKGDILKEIDKRSPNPSYLAIIGHSFGGWTACRVSRDTVRKPDYVGLIDPVFGTDNSMEPIDNPRAVKLRSWTQDNGIEFFGGPCFNHPVPCSSSRAGFACGYKDVEDAYVEDYQAFDVEYKQNWDGSIAKHKCRWWEIDTRAVHTNMDENGNIRKLICNEIFDDIYKQVVAAEEFSVILSSLAK
ncbi:hypothetical protein [Priestia aryabhattai]|uniref:hypothetical protein n=1 Tax=Priestia aryabhattai TaxID=412384 RepID=UPI0008DD88C8|nr:hypothetical protein [Priestia aryabhattai]OHY73338.1 hypothetical protein BCV52_26875 [Priestia aryabhattai]